MIGHYFATVVIMYFYIQEGYMQSGLYWDGRMDYFNTLTCLQHIYIYYTYVGNRLIKCKEDPKVH